MRRTSGLSLLILIFVSLCLITFSLLSVSESRADQALGEKMAARTTTYYEANTKANQLLSKIDAQLANYLRLFSRIVKGIGILRVAHQRYVLDEVGLGGGVRLALA